MPDTELKTIMAAWETAIAMIDATEPEMRELIESRLMGVSPEKVNLVTSRIDALLVDLTRVRTLAIKMAFRHLRDTLPDEGPIYQHSFATHAAGVLGAELERIRQTVTVSVHASLSNTDIAHAVIGSRQNHGVNGQTEITRQLILRLAQGYLRTRKRRMAGATT